jgi:hypothetical protein
MAIEKDVEEPEQSSEIFKKYPATVGSVTTMWWSSSPTTCA